VAANVRSVTRQHKIAKNHWKLHTPRVSFKPASSTTVDAGNTNPVMSKSASATFTMKAFPETKILAKFSVIVQYKKFHIYKFIIKKTLLS
jgi:hypothetical protein